MSPSKIMKLLVALAFSILLVGCGDDSASNTVKKESVIADDSADSLLGNGSFTVGLAGWNIDTPDGVEISAITDEGVDDSTSMQLSADGSDIDRAAVATQSVTVLPNRGEGAEYSLRLEARSEELTRPVLVELRLTYTDGDYEFFSGGPEGLTTGIPEGTSNGWTPISVRAIARKEIEVIDVFALDSGTGKLGGKVWVDAVTLGETK